MKVSLRRGFEKDKTAGMPLFSNRSGVVGDYCHIFNPPSMDQGFRNVGVSQTMKHFTGVVNSKQSPNKRLQPKPLRG